MRRACDYCGKVYDAKLATSKFCKASCRASWSKRAKEPAAVAAQGALSATQAALDAADRSGTYLGAVALVLAARVDATPGSGAATLARELRATMDEALKGVAAVKDELDELKRKRDERRRAG